MAPPTELQPEPVNPTEEEPTEDVLASPSNEHSILGRFSVQVSQDIALLSILGQTSFQPMLYCVPCRKYHGIDRHPATRHLTRQHAPYFFNSIAHLQNGIMPPRMCVQEEEFSDVRGFIHPTLSLHNYRMALKLFRFGIDPTEVLNTFITRQTFKMSGRHIQILSEPKIVGGTFLLRVQYIIWTPPAESFSDEHQRQSRFILVPEPAALIEHILTSGHHVSFMFRNVVGGYHNTQWLQHADRIAECKLNHQKARRYQKEVGGPRLVSEPESCERCGPFGQPDEKRAGYRVDLLPLVADSGAGSVSHGTALWVSRWLDLGTGNHDDLVIHDPARGYLASSYAEGDRHPEDIQLAFDGRVEFGDWRGLERFHALSLVAGRDVAAPMGH